MSFQNRIRLIALTILLFSSLIGFWLDPPDQFLAGITYAIIVGATALFEFIVLIFLGIYYRFATPNKPAEIPSNDVLDSPISTPMASSAANRDAYCFQTAVGILFIGGILFFGGVYLIDEVL